LPGTKTMPLFLRILARHETVPLLSRVLAQHIKCRCSCASVPSTNVTAARACHCPARSGTAALARPCPEWKGAARLAGLCPARNRTTDFTFLCSAQNGAASLISLTSPCPARSGSATFARPYCSRREGATPKISIQSFKKKLRLYFEDLLKFRSWESYTFWKTGLSVPFHDNPLPLTKIMKSACRVLFHMIFYIFRIT